MISGCRPFRTSLANRRVLAIWSRTNTQFAQGELNGCSFANPNDCKEETNTELLGMQSGLDDLSDL